LSGFQVPGLSRVADDKARGVEMSAEAASPGVAAQEGSVRDAGPESVARRVKGIFTGKNRVFSGVTAVRLRRSLAAPNERAKERIGRTRPRSLDPRPPWERTILCSPTFALLRVF